MLGFGRGVLGIADLKRHAAFGLCTRYFVCVALLLEVPREFVDDMQQRWGVEVEPGCRAFDLFR
jgi:hypothetical protein